MTLKTGVHDRRKTRQPISRLRRCVCLNLKKFREMAGWSQKQVADLLGMAQPSYCAIEGGRDDIRLETLGKLADVFQTDVRALLAPVEEEAAAKPKKKTKKTA